MGGMLGGCGVPLNAVRGFQKNNIAINFAAESEFGGTTYGAKK